MQSRVSLFLDQSDKFYSVFYDSSNLYRKIHFAVHISEKNIIDYLKKMRRITHSEIQNIRLFSSEQIDYSDSVLSDIHNMISQIQINPDSENGLILHHHPSTSFPAYILGSSVSSTDLAVFYQLYYGITNTRSSSLFQTDRQKINPGIPEIRQYTLVIIFDREKILLGRKKRGFGEGWWNGFGGKIELGESPEQAAARELKEESGLTAHQLEKSGTLRFFMEDSNHMLDVEVFRCHHYSGTPAETEEMLPRWFPLSKIPYEKMWIDDPLWLPHVLKKQSVHCFFDYQDILTLQSSSVFYG